MCLIGAVRFARQPLLLEQPGRKLLSFSLLQRKSLFLQRDTTFLQRDCLFLQRNPHFFTTNTPLAHKNTRLQQRAGLIMGFRYYLLVKSV